MSQYERDRALMESARIAAWAAYTAARPNMNRGPIYERMFNTGFERAWAKQANKLATLNALKAKLEAAEMDAEALRVALRFYASGSHFHVSADEDFDSVSGEPDNWLCSGREDSETMIEDGRIALSALRGQTILWDDDEKPIPVIGESTKTQRDAAIAAQGGKHAE